MAKFEQWEGFQGKNWVNSVDVRDFIQCNYTPYDGDETFQLHKDNLHLQTCCPHFAQVPRSVIWFFHYT